METLKLSDASCRKLNSIDDRVFCSCLLGSNGVHQDRARQHHQTRITGTGTHHVLAIHKSTRSEHLETCYTDRGVIDLLHASL
ncbi:hypothetical protein GDO81_017571 [Engystomops pustulosus]|uniref:Uncharacterized protein n=1 Tax=Engystomops pustulosus TaxID=76066 RepID=A0AAV7A1F4_ENGPU|nr:hypothetical protein GDO81_017571 [Engystomops pustulosus]